MATHGKARMTATFDNPTAGERQAWQDGELVARAPFGLVRRLAREGLAPAWLPGQVLGDRRAIGAWWAPAPAAAQ